MVDSTQADAAGTHCVHINRPVHQARRDAFFERAVELLSHPIDTLPPQGRQQLISRVLQSLRTARRHAFLAAAPTDPSSREQDFLRFLDLKIETVRSARAMIDHQLVLEEEEGFLRSFLRTDPNEFQLPAMHFQRRAEDILHGLWHILRLAQSPFHTLRNEARESRDTSQLERYDRAYRAACIEANDVFPRSAPPEGGLPK